jgi:predicted nuclease of predicted toxin-antitoxin system
MAVEPRLFLALYVDEDITSELAPALRERGFEAQSAAEAGMLNADDESQLHYAVRHNMALVTCNADHFISLAKAWAEVGQTHTGIIVSSDQHKKRQLSHSFVFQSASQFRPLRLFNGLQSGH